MTEPGSAPSTAAAAASSSAETQRRAQVVGAAAGVACAAIVVGLIVYLTTRDLVWADRLPSLLSALLAVVTLGVAIYAGARQRAEARQAEQAHQELRRAERELGDADHLALPALWEVTHKRLDYYHQIATGQARQSFRNAQVAMGVGFLLLVIFAALALNAPTTTTSVVTGTLGAASLAFAGYLGRTFVRSQEAAAGHLRAYFDQPLEFSRYLAAERLLTAADQLDPAQRAAITADLLRAVITPAAAPGDGPPATTVTVTTHGTAPTRATTTDEAKDKPA